MKQDLGNKLTMYAQNEKVGAPVNLSEEMQRAYIDYSMSVIVGRALPDARDGLKPSNRRVLYAMRETGAAAQPLLHQVRQGRRRSARQIPPARRRQRLRHARAHGAGLLHALPADRRPGQLRLDRRRSRRRLPVHRVPPGRDCRGIAAPTSTRTPSISSPTSTRRNTNRSSCPRASRTCWSTAAPASPSAWRPTSRRTTSTRSWTPVAR